MLKVAMLSTGEEVLHGDIVDTNASWLGETLYQSGFQLSARSTVGDQSGVLQDEIERLSKTFDVVIVNGGLGPTTDDLTASAAAKAANQKLTLFQEWLTVLEEKFTRRGLTMPDSNLKQAMLPEKASIIDNPIGTACGFEMQIDKAMFYFTPGVPSEFKKMVCEQILPSLSDKHRDILPSECSRIYTVGLSESGISDKLDLIKLPEEYELGYRSYMPFIEVKIFGPAADMERRLKLLQVVYGHLKDNVVSVDEPMIDNVGALLAETGTTLSIAEQASGGFLTSWVHENELVAQQLKQSWVMNTQMDKNLVEQDPLAAALALAAATRENGKATFGLSCGKLKDNVFAIALSTGNGEWGQVLEFARNYAKQDKRSLIAAVMLDMLRRHLEQKAVFGQYSSLVRKKELYVPNSAV
ncbi:CinA-like protein [Vibrio nigripulchritudo]|uniref:CinA family nicotinamide mononucleotide deamidase-related protein n=1 Tax=Vibrio nigripulchritudo TaxID=28173 RepID=UPI00190B6088|nr:CinA family nicotinamide mononucleotide deamidase-related protein [Vibrio nigripulchritudo]BCL69388.1 CinA-like protein [Vibrio nigripulchritudo]BDU30724.1 CinA-like protein [Vibrio nigripulchritudo]